MSNLRQYIPVCSNLNVQGHLDIEEVLVLAQVTSHLPLGALELIIQLVNCLLGKHRAKTKHARLSTLKITRRTELHFLLQVLSLVRGQKNIT